MALEKVTAEVVLELDESSAKKVEGEVKEFARDTGKELDKNTLIKMELDLASLKLEKKQASKELRSLQKEYEQGLIPRSKVVEAQKAFDSISSKTTEARRELNNYRNTGDKSLSRLQAKFNQVENSIDRNGNSVRDLIRKIGRGEATFKDFGETGKSAFQGIQVPVIKLIGIVGGLGASIGGAFAFVTDLDRAFKQLQNQTNTSGKEFEGLRKSLINLNSSGFGTMQENVKTLSTLRNELELTGDELDRVAIGTTAIAENFNKDVNETLRATTSLMKNYEISGTRANDLITASLQATGDTYDDVLDSINEYSAIASDAKIPVEDFINVLLNGTKAGIRNTDELADVQREFAIRLRDGSKSSQEAFDNLGLSYENFQSKVSSGEITISQGMREIAKNIQAIEDPILRNQVGTDLLGTKFEDNGDKILEVLANVEDSLGDVEGRTDDLVGNSTEGIGDLAKEWATLVTDIKAILLPFVSAIASAIASAIRFVRDFTKSINLLTIALISLMSAKALLGFYSLLLKMPAILKSTALATGTLTKANGLLAISLGKLKIAVSLALGPIGLLTVGITGIAYAWTEAKKSRDLYFASDANTASVESELANAVTESATELNKLKAKKLELESKSDENSQKELERTNKLIDLENARLKQYDLIGKSRDIQDTSLIDKEKRANQEKIKQLEEELGIKKEIKKEEEDALGIGGGGGGGGGGSANETEIKSEEQTIEELQKLRDNAIQEEIDQRNKFEAYLKDLEQKRNDRQIGLLDGLKEGYTSVANVYDESIRKSEERTKEFEEKIKDLKQEISDIDQELSELGEDRASTLGERNIEILEKTKDLEAELKEIRNSGETTNDDLERERKISEELIALGRERETILKNTSDEERKEAQRIADQNPTERFLEELEVRKKDLESQKSQREEELAILQDQKEQEEIIFDNLTTKKENLEKRYQDIVNGIQEQITDKLYIENQKRIKSLKEVEQQAIATARALENAGSGGGNASSSSNNTSNTVNNNPTVVVNANVSNGVDVDNLGNELANKIQLSSKGIN